MHTKFWKEDVKERTHLEDQGTTEIMLKWIVKNMA
jgi:hypothetical protein